MSFTVYMKVDKIQIVSNGHNKISNRRINFKANETVLKEALNSFGKTEHQGFINRLINLSEAGKFREERDNIDIIYNLYKACLNPDKTINKNAANTVFIMAGKKTNDIKENIKLFFKQHMPNYYRYFGLKGISEAINACKDNMGNIRTDNLEYLLYMDNQGNNIQSFSHHAKLIKDKNGIFDKDKIEFYNSLKTKGIEFYFPIFLDKNNNITEAAKNLSQNVTVQKILTANKKQYENFVCMIQSALQNNAENREEVIELINKYIKLIFATNFKNSATMFYDNNGKLDADNIKTVVKHLKGIEKKNIFLIPNSSVADILKDKDGKIKDENVEQYYRLLKKYSPNDIYDFSRLFTDIFKNKDGIINETFTNFATLQRIAVDKNDIHNSINGITKDFNEYKLLQEMEQKFIDKEMLSTDNILYILENLYKTDSLDTKSVYTKFKNKSLLSTIIDIKPSDDDNYSKILNYLEKIKDINYNNRDTDDKTYIEKIMINENLPLLKLVNLQSQYRQDKDVIKYKPELDKIYKIIENEDFKKELTKLRVNFADIKKAGMNKNIEEFEAVKHQLNSPFFNSTNGPLLMATIWILSLSKENKVFCQYLYNNYSTILPEYAKFNLSEMMA